MKKLLIAAGLLASFVGVSQAELGIFRGFQDKAYELHYSSAMQAATTSTTTILIDLSDTTNYPHKETGYLSIDAIIIEVDKAAATTFTAKVGVVSAVNSATGTVTWFTGSAQTLNVSNTNANVYYNFHPYIINTRVNPVAPTTGANTPDGATPYISTNDYTRGSTVYQTDVNLPTSLDTSAAPAAGDILLEITKASAAATFRVKVLYHSQSR